MSQNPLKYYVYEHWRPDTDVIFYVGKGKGTRAHTLWNRNKLHRALQAELAKVGLTFEVKFVFRGLSNLEALRLERERIVYWRDLGAILVNITDGGLGTSGMKFSAETRAKMSRDRKGRRITEQQRHNISKALTGRKKSPEHIAKVAAAIATINCGRKHTPEHIAQRLASTLERNPNHFRDAAIKCPVICVNDGIRYSTMTDAANAYGLQKGRVWDTCNGATKHTKSGLIFRYQDAKPA